MDHRLSPSPLHNHQSTRAESPLYISEGPEDRAPPGGEEVLTEEEKENRERNRQMFSRTVDMDIPKPIIKYRGVGPKDEATGMPLTLRTSIDDKSQKDWYKQMYSALHKPSSIDRDRPSSATPLSLHNRPEMSRLQQSRSSYDSNFESYQQMNETSINGRAEPRRRFGSLEETQHRPLLRGPSPVQNGLSSSSGGYQFNARSNQQPSNSQGDKFIIQRIHPAEPGQPGSLEGFPKQASPPRRYSDDSSDFSAQNKLMPRRQTSQEDPRTARSRRDFNFQDKPGPGRGARPAASPIRENLQSNSSRGRVDRNDSSMTLVPYNGVNNNAMTNNYSNDNQVLMNGDNYSNNNQVYSNNNNNQNGYMYNNNNNDQVLMNNNSNNYQMQNFDRPERLLSPPNTRELMRLSGSKSADIFRQGSRNNYPNNQYYNGTSEYHRGTDYDNVYRRNSAENQTAYNHRETYNHGVNNRPRNDANSFNNDGSSYTRSNLSAIDGMRTNSSYNGLQNYPSERDSYQKEEERYSERSQSICSEDGVRHLPALPATTPRITVSHGKARALYSFNAHADRELSFKKGEILNLLRQIDKNWFEGSLRGKMGLIPANYIQVTLSIQEAKEQAMEKEGRAKAKYSFRGQTEHELSFRKGDVIVLIRRVDDNWYEGRTAEGQGIFPVTYVETLSHPITPLTSPLSSVAPSLPGSSPRPISPTSSITSSLTAPSLPSAPLSPRGGMMEPFLAEGRLQVYQPPTNNNPHQYPRDEIANNYGRELVVRPHSTEPTRWNALPFNNESNSFMNTGGYSAYDRGLSMDFPSMYATLPRNSHQGRSGQSAPLAIEYPDARGEVLTGGEPRDGERGTVSPYKAIGVKTYEDGTERQSVKKRSGGSLDLPQYPAYRALYNYRIHNDDELELQEGDVVHVMEVCEDGWFVGVSQRTRKFGTFPGNYVQKL